MSQGTQGLRGIQGPPGPTGPVAVVTQNGVNSNFQVAGDVSIGGASLTNALGVLNSKLNTLLTTMELVPDANLEIHTTLNFAGYNHEVYITVPPTYNPHSTDLFPAILYIPGIGQLKDSTPFDDPSTLSSYTSKRGVNYDTSGGAATRAWSQFITIFVNYSNEIFTKLLQGVFGIPTEQSLVESVMDSLLPRLNVDMNKLHFMGGSTGGQGLYTHLIPGRSITEFNKIITFSSSPCVRWGTKDEMVYGVKEFGMGYWNYENVGSIGVDASGVEFESKIVDGIYLPEDRVGAIHLPFESTIYYSSLTAVFSYVSIDPPGETLAPKLKIRAFLSKIDNVYCRGALESTLAFMKEKGADTKYIPSMETHYNDIKLANNLAKFPLVDGQPDMTVPEYLLSDF